MPADALQTLPYSGSNRDDAPAFSDAVPEGWKKNTHATTGDSMVSANELTSLSALIVYVAHNSGDNEFRVERRVADRFNIPNVKCLPALQYDNAIRFLVDSLSRDS